jgi:hypothetical protein
MVLMKFLRQQRVRRVLIAFLTFSIGIGVSYSWPSQKAIEDFIVDTVTPDPPRDEFVALSDACGSRFSSHEYLISTTGQSLEQTGESFDSDDTAHNALVRKLSHADRILEQTLILDEHKRPVGERAVAVFFSGASIFERYGEVLSIINAPTIELALEFESTMVKNNH